MTQPSGEAIRVGGTIMQIARVPRTLDARIDTRDSVLWSSIKEDGDLVVEIRGTPVRVEVPASALVDAPRTEKGSWAEIVAKGGGRFREDSAPAFKPARLDIVELAPGAEIEIYGEVTARGFNDDGGMRDAPSQSVQAIRALIVATGKDRTERIDRAIHERFPPAARPAKPTWAEKQARAKAERAMDPRTSEPGSPLFRPHPIVAIHALVWAVLGLAFGVHAQMSQSATWAAAALTAGFVAILARPSPAALRMRVLEGRYGADWTLPDAGWFILGLVYISTVIPLGGSLGAKGLAWPTLGVIALILVGMVLAIPTYARFGSLRGAPLWTGELGVRAALEGDVLDPTPAIVGQGHVAIGRGTGYDENIGSNPDRVVWQRFHGVGSFLIKTKAGIVEVFPQQIVWGTSVLGRVKTSDRGADYEEIEIIPVGGKVLAAGWIEAGPQGGPPRLVARGTTPAVLVATGPHGDPRNWLGRLRRARALTALFVVAIGAGLVTVISL